MRNLNRKNGSSSSVVVRPRLLPIALAILMKIYSNIQVDTTTRLVNLSLDLNIIKVIKACYYDYGIYIARPCCCGAVQMYHGTYLCGGTHW